MKKNREKYLHSAEEKENSHKRETTLILTLIVNSGNSFSFINEIVMHKINDLFLFTTRYCLAFRISCHNTWQ